MLFRLIHKKSYEINSFNQVFDKAAQYLQQLKENIDLFSFLLTFNRLSKETILKCATDFQMGLKHVESVDLNGYKLLLNV